MIVRRVMKMKIIIIMLNVIETLMFVLMVMMMAWLWYIHTYKTQIKSINIIVNTLKIYIISFHFGLFYIVTFWASA